MVERLAARHAIALDREVFGGRLGRGRLEADGLPPAELAILTPLTFMNLSGDSVVAALHGLDVEDPSRDLLVVCDDVDLPFGRLRLRPGGGAGGHRGLAHILERLDRRDVPRLRFGVGRSQADLETAQYVLLPFTEEEERLLPARLDRAVDAALAALRAGITAAMNDFNHDPEDETAAG